MLENEYKWLLTKDVYDILFEYINEALIVENEQTHINYYYDTDVQSFRKQNTTVRMRYCNGELTGTLKKHSDQPNSVEKAWIQSELPCYIYIEWKKLFMQGEMVTHRTSFGLGKGITLSFDENTYLGKTDYEVELEFDFENSTLAKQWKNSLSTFLENLNILNSGIVACGESKSKSERFFIEKDKFTNRRMDYFDDAGEYRDNYY